ncbi:hypothetical protein RZN25_17555 [Bacillaceae bacterium S4-13-56]
MALTVFSLILWLTIFCFSLLPKKLSLLENSFVFFVLSVVIMNSFTIASLNLKWIESNKETEMFLVYILYRAIIYPVALLFLTNLIFMYETFSTKLVGAILVPIFILLVEISGEKLNVYTYKQWNNWYSITEIILFSLFTLLITKFIRSLKQRMYQHESI